VVGVPAEIVVGDLSWDHSEGRNVDHLAQHGVTPADVSSLLDYKPLFFLNLPGRSATHLMIGRDQRGRSLLVALARTRDENVWYPVTAWQSRVAHEILEKEGLL
jgi:hypothetical protein